MAEVRSTRVDTGSFDGVARSFEAKAHEIRRAADARDDLLDQVKGVVGVDDAGQRFIEGFTKAEHKVSESLRLLERIVAATCDQVRGLGELYADAEEHASAAASGVAGGRRRSDLPDVGASGGAAGGVEDGFDGVAGRRG